MSDLADLYQDVILEHSRHPRNSGRLEGADRQARGNNPLCGDRVTIYLKLDGERIADIRFEAKGCAISVASASMMSAMVKGKTVAEAESLFARFHDLVTGKNGSASGQPDLDELQALSGVKDFPTRIKCATLPWHAMTAALADKREEVRTE